MPKKQVTSSKIRQPTGHFSHATMIEARGRLVFEGKGQCLSCHAVNGIGSRLGPSLTEIGSFRRVVEPLFEPAARVITNSGFSARNGAPNP
jgi:cytochrome c peroxidase